MNAPKAPCWSCGLSEAVKEGWYESRISNKYQEVNALGGLRSSGAFLHLRPIRNRSGAFRIREPETVQEGSDQSNAGILPVGTRAGAPRSETPLRLRRGPGAY